jgi:hypothetical protein
MGYNQINNCFPSPESAGAFSENTEVTTMERISEAKMLQVNRHISASNWPRWKQHGVWGFA